MKRQSVIRPHPPSLLDPTPQPQPWWPWFICMVLLVAATLFVIGMAIGNGTAR